MTAETRRETERARAKVNLHLHVTGRRADGFHLLDSLVVFPDISDLIEASLAPGLSLRVEGPFAGGLPTDGGNLVLRAAEALRERAGGAPGAALRLVKNLPVASGIGGGSADAAAALRALDRLWGLALGEEALRGIGAGLGADVPVCVASRAAIMGGIGERLSFLPDPPAGWLALVNPGAPVSTPQVFAALARRDSPQAPPPPGGSEGIAALACWAEAQSNDLEEPAFTLAPAARAARGAMAASPGCLLARMSGSGATSFGLFADGEGARRAAQALSARGWWAAAGPFGHQL